MKTAKKTILENGIQWTFADGEIVTVQLDEFPEEMVHQLALHGLSQKGGDSYASSVSVAEAKTALADVVANLRANLWASRSTGPSLLVQALALATNQALDKAAAVVAGMTDTQQKALAKHKDIVAARASIVAERAKKAAMAAEADTDEGDDLTALFTE